MKLAPSWLQVLELERLRANVVDDDDNPLSVGHGV